MIIVDTHLHIYPCHNIGKTLNYLINNLESLHPSAQKWAFLAERADCNIFREMAEGKHDLSGSNITLTPVGGDMIKISRNSSHVVKIFPGRQIISSERIEILALLRSKPLPDNMPAQQVIDAVLASGAVPVLPWSPGKWFGERGDVVRHLIETNCGGNVLIGDTSLRPVWWGKPGLMAYAESKGMKVICGSDPLPFPGDDSNAGVYASLMDSDINDDLISIRDALTAPGFHITPAGRRSKTMDFIRRQVCNLRAKRKHQR